MSYAERLIETPDGRSLEISTLGDPGGTTVLVHHGSPGSSRLAGFFADVAEECGLFVVTPSRAGYGDSARLPGRDVAAAAADARAALDSLGRDDYVAVGWSGGGPHALACAALDAPRCRGAWSLAGVAPIDADFDWTEGMGPENVEEFTLSREGGPRLEELVREQARAFSGATPENVIGLFGGLWSPEDLAALADRRARAHLAESCRHAFANGGWGYYDDDRAFFSPWGFDVAQVSVPVAVWFGDHDLMVPAAHGEWLSRHVPAATPVHLPDDGHVTLITNRMRELAEAILALD